MAFCRECGKGINDKAVVCPYCGCETGVKWLSKDAQDKDNGVLGWFLFSFIFPCAGSVILGLLWGFVLSLVGVIMGLIWRENRPYCSKACLKGSVSGIIFVVLYALIKAVIFRSI